MDAKEKVRENRFRRVLHRRGYELNKARVRDPHAIEYGKYCICDPQTNAVVVGTEGGYFNMTLDDVEAWIEKKWPR